jgi:hypothetical protein
MPRKQGFDTEITEKDVRHHAPAFRRTIARSAEDPCCSVISVPFLRGLRVEIDCLIAEGTQVVP